MRCLTLPLLWAVASASILQGRQLGGKGVQAKFAGIDKTEPRIRKGATRNVVKFGPYTLKAAKSGGRSKGGGGMGMLGGGGQSFFLNIKEGVCHSCTVYGGRVKILLEDGKTEATVKNGIYIHHVLTYDLKKKVKPFMSSCDSRNPSPNRSSTANQGLVQFLTAGDDTGHGDVLYAIPNSDFNTGYHIGANDNFMAWADIVNYNKNATKFYLAYEIEYTPGIVGVNTRDVLLSATGCAAKAIKTSNLGPTNTTSEKFVFYEDGNIVIARGHLHEGGTQMALHLNGKFLCSSKATYGHGGDAGKEAITEMTYCKGPIPIKKGDTVTFTAQYDFSKHKRRQGPSGADGQLMGLWNIKFAAAK